MISNAGSKSLLKETSSLVNAKLVEKILIVALGLMRMVL